MTCHEATFGKSQCHVCIEARPSVNSDPIHIATPYLRTRHALEWFSGATGGAVELPASSEASALDRATTFLTGQVGPQTDKWRPTPMHGVSLPIVGPPDGGMATEAWQTDGSR
jgi:hypothetical protein